MAVTLELSTRFRHWLRVTSRPMQLVLVAVPTRGSSTSLPQQVVRASTTPQMMQTLLLGSCVRLQTKSSTAPTHLILFLQIQTRSGFLSPREAPCRTFRVMLQTALATTKLKMLLRSLAQPVKTCAVVTQVQSKSASSLAVPPSVSLKVQRFVTSETTTVTARWMRDVKPVSPKSVMASTMTVMT